MPNLSDSTTTPTSKRNSVPLVVAIFAAWSSGKAADAAVQVTLGYWGAFAVGLLTAAVVAGVVHAVVSLLISPKFANEICLRSSVS